jgi:hypothetical protein
MNIRSLFALLFLASVTTVTYAAAKEECHGEKINGNKFEMCLQRGQNFQHDTYILKLDKSTIFSLVDDFAEEVKITHTILPGPAIEFAPSLEGYKTTTISGGCVPVSKDNMEIARVCNFSWGNLKIVKDVRFEF